MAFLLEYVVYLIRLPRIPFSIVKRWKEGEVVSPKPRNKIETRKESDYAHGA